MPTPNGPLQSDAVFVLAEGASTLDPRRHLAAAGGRAGRVTGRPDVRWSKSHGESSTTEPAKTAEALRLDESLVTRGAVAATGPYLSERQWGTVREDDSELGDSWDYFTHDQALVAVPSWARGRPRRFQ